MELQMELHIYDEQELPKVNIAALLKEARETEWCERVVCFHVHCYYY